MKKILFMVTSMNIGGVEKSLLSLLSVIPKEKYDITLLLLEKKGGFLDYVPKWVKVKETSWFKQIKPVILQPPQETVQDYYRKKQFLKITTFVCSYFISKHLNKRHLYYQEVLKETPILNENYDLAISYQGPTDVIDYYIAKKVVAKRKISWVHFDVSKHQMNPRLYEKLYAFYDKIYVVSHEAKNRLLDKIPAIKSKTEVYPNVVPFHLIQMMSKEKVEFDEHYQGIRIVTVGRLSEEKGQDLAIKALYKLRQAGIDARWYCIGEGNYRKQYEKLIQEYGLEDEFILLGSTPNPYPYMARADLYVQTSRHEGYCLTLAEAKCLQKPIVTTNFIGAYEQIEDGKTGYIVGCNENKLFERIKYLIKHQSIREELKKHLAQRNMYKKEDVTKLFDYAQ